MLKISKTSLAILPILFSSTAVYSKDTTSPVSTIKEEYKQYIQSTENSEVKPKKLKVIKSKKDLEELVEESDIYKAKESGSGLGPSSILTTTNVLIGGAALIGAGIAVGGGGGGSASITSSEPSVGIDGLFDPEDNTGTNFATTEAELSEALGSDNAGFNAYAAYTRGYDGRIFNRDSSGNLFDTDADGFIKVAIIDDGVELDHPDLDGNISAGSGAFCNSSGCTTGGSSGDNLIPTDDHGTNVAGFIAAEKNDIGSHGVAPLAKIVPIKFDFSAIGEFRSINHALDQGAKIINASYGTSQPIVDATESDPGTLGTTATGITPSQLRSDLTIARDSQSLLQAYQRLVTTDSIMVYSSGNEYFSEPTSSAGVAYYFQGDLDSTPSSKPTGYDIVNPEKADFTDHIIASIALNSDKTIADFSNRCGVAANWCLAAPGVSEYTTDTDGTYDNNVSGTSFSAPAVSGALAVVAGAYPHLTAGEILNVIYETAEDLGDVGVDEVFGRGLIDLDKATSPTDGGWDIATGLSSSSLNSMALTSFEKSSLSMSSSFGNAFSKLDANIMFFDKFKRNFNAPVNSFADNSAVKLKNSSYLYARKRDKETVQQISESEDVSFSFSKTTNSKIDNLNDKQSSSFASDIKLNKDEAVNITFNFNEKEVKPNKDYNDSFVSTSLGFVPTSALDTNFNSLNFGYSKKDLFIDINIAKSTFAQDTQNYSASFEGNDATSFATTVGFKNEDEYKISFNSGIMIEEDSFLGSRASGAFDFGEDATTYFAGVAGDYKIDNSFNLFAELNLGYSKINEVQNSLISNVGNVFSDSMKLGITSNNFGFMVSRPFAINNGSANLRLPQSIDADGNLGFGEYDIDLANKYRETNFEVFYNLEPNLIEGDLLELNTVYRINPNGLDEEDEVLGMFKYGYKF